VTGIDLPGERVDEVIVHKHLVPRTDKIYRDVVGDLEVSAHSEETLECTVDRIMERDAVETAVSRVSQKVLVIGGGDVGGIEETRGQLCGSSTTTTTKISGRHTRCTRRGLTHIKSQTYSHR